MAKEMTPSITDIEDAHQRGLIDDREKQILLLRTPDQSGKRTTQKAIGEMLGISGAWVCQLETRARTAVQRASAIDQRISEIAVIDQTADQQMAQRTKRRWLHSLVGRLR